ncbi:transposase, partial [Escherichia coli]|uniref:transposase n=1 Tax=Escherichia coli TaxID=562 RepID=UPI00244B69A8
FSDPGPVFHTIVSIKNDGHYFCRAGGNRPDGLNEPVTKNVTPGRRKGCPNYPPEFKQQLVAASCEPGISISKLALENGINANLLFK